MSIAEDLVRELTEQVNLGAVDAHRSAFAALACSNGWSKARVGRYLGISRARVGQKIDKLLHYATTLDTVPILTKTMKQAVRKKSVRGEYDDVVEFGAEQWEDLNFAKQLLAKLETS